MGRPPLPSTQDHQFITWCLAECFAEGVWSLEALVSRGEQILGRRPRWLRPLARRLLAAFEIGVRPRTARIVSFLESDRRFPRFRDRDALTIKWQRRSLPEMAPAPGGPSNWQMPAILTPEMLADWLELTREQLDWLADSQARARRNGVANTLRHYRYRWQNKRSGSARLIEAPKPRLKQIQRRLLDEILTAIPPHDAAHGFRPGRSVRTYIEPHLGRDVVLKMDLRDFFPSITAAWILAVFMTAGYPEPVATLLTALCTNCVPSEVWSDASCLIQGAEHWRLKRLHQDRHLPQGAPTSPALANLCAYRFDCRLHALATSVGASYTRYADDLAFSGDRSLARMIRRFTIQVGSIALEEGFAVHHRKTRVMSQSVRQRVAGVVLNHRPNPPREDYDRLKAILHNCLKYGPSSQNQAGHPHFQAQLAGRIAYITSLNPHRGHRLRAWFDQVNWALDSDQGERST